MKLVSRNILRLGARDKSGEPVDTFKKPRP